VNAARNNSYQDEPELDYQVGVRPNDPAAERTAQRRRPEHARISRPSGFNGKHRRRNKRYSF
jgi:hypothetical protein